MNIDHSRRVSFALCGAAAVLALPLAGSAGAAVDARLNGPFNVTGTIRSDTLHPEYVGESFDRKWRFSSTCDGDGPCDTVEVDRLSGDDNHIVYDLTKSGPGTWTGTHTYRGVTSCSINGRVVYKAKGKQTEKMTVEVTDSDADGAATEISGSLRIVFPALTKPIKPAACKRFFSKHGLGPGDHPKQATDFVGEAS